MRFKIFLEDKLKGGLADKMKPSDFDAKQLALGTEVEMEHVDDRKLAQEIAMDHLAEDPKYYTKLKKIHNESTKINQAEMHRVRKKKAMEVKCRPVDLDFIGMEDYGMDGKGWYFNCMDKRHKLYGSTLMQLEK